MATSFHCPCGRALLADDAHRGMQVTCPACQRLLVVPPASGAMAQPAAPDAGPSAVLTPSPVGPTPPSPDTRICTGCQAQIPASLAVCPRCGCFLEQTPDRPGLPWENRDEHGLAPSALTTLRLLLFEPTTAFRAMRLQEPVGQATLFLLLIGGLGAVIGACWSAVFQGVMMNLMARFMPSSATLPTSPLPAWLGGVIGIVMAPFGLLFTWVFVSALAHLTLTVTGSRRKGFPVTLAVCAYALGATQVINIIPLCGGWVAYLWGIVLIALGLSRTHDCESWQGTVAALSPLILGFCCCGGGVALMLLLGAGTAAFNS